MPDSPTKQEVKYFIAGMFAGHNLHASPISMESMLNKIRELFELTQEDLESIANCLDSIFNPLEKDAAARESEG